MLACRVNLSPGNLALILFFVGGWFVSAALALINLIFITFLPVSARRKKAQFAFLAFYVVPGVFLMARLHHIIPFSDDPGILWQAYALAIPFLVIFHFAFLLWTRQKARVAAMATQNEIAA